MASEKPSPLSAGLWSAVPVPVVGDPNTLWKRRKEEKSGHWIGTQVRGAHSEKQQENQWKFSQSISSAPIEQLHPWIRSSLRHSIPITPHPRLYLGHFPCLPGSLSFPPCLFEQNQIRSSCWQDLRHNYTYIPPNTVKGWTYKA